MVKKIHILGLSLDNYTVKEAAMQAEGYLDGGGMNTIEIISMQMLLASEGDPVLKEVISSLDLAVIGEKEILKAAGLATLQRMRETDGNDFPLEFFRRVERGKKNIFLLGETRGDVDAAKDGLMRECPKLEVAGEYAVEDCTGDFDAVINEMNATTPDVIVSILPTPLQEHFFWEHKDKMNAAIWCGMGGFCIGRRKTGFWESIKSAMHFGKLKSSMDKYKKAGPQGAVAEEEGEEG